VGRITENRFWVRYNPEGKVIALYRLSFSGSSFERWNKGIWVDESDRYERITQDADSDEVSDERANQILNEFVS
jgi:hypothetical protein